MKSIAQQDFAELGGRTSVLGRQKRDHIELDHLLQRLRATTPAKQGPILLRIYRLVFPHAFAEEAVLWPAIRRALPEGHKLTLQVECEHQEINELVMRLESLAVGSAEREDVLERVIGLLQRDVRDEEDELLPRLQANVSVARLRFLGLAWEAVRSVAPTRAHPFVSRRPPGNVLSALPLSVIDRCRDRLDLLLYRGAGPAAVPLRSLSAALTRASHAVEQLPGMGSGENAATRMGRGTRFSWGTAVLAAIAVTSGVLAARQITAARRHPAIPETRARPQGVSAVTLP